MSKPRIAGWRLKFPAFIARERGGKAPFLKFGEAGHLDNVEREAAGVRFGDDVWHNPAGAHFDFMGSDMAANMCSAIFCAREVAAPLVTMVMNGSLPRCRFLDY